MKDVYETGSKLFLLNIGICLGTFIQVLDTSIANVAIPYIAGNLNTSADEGTWVITSFAASNAIVLPLTGWLSDYFGRVRLFVWSVILFSLTSFLCALSTSLSMLVFFRVIQGAVAGTLIPLSQSLMFSNNPPEKQGSALGLWGMVVIVAPILGPIIGGYLTDVYSWPWIFYINVPIGLLSGFIVWTFLSQKESQLIRNPIDWTGLCLLSLGIATLQIMLDKGKDLDWFESNAIIALTITSAVSLIYFIIWNRYQKHPIVDFSFFSNRNFLIGTVGATMGFLVYFSGTVTIPLWLQTEQNYTAYWAGIAVAPIGFVPFFLSTTVGKNLTRFDLRKVAALSFFLFSLGLLLQTHFTTQVSLGFIMFTRFLQGFGIVIFFLPLLQLAISEIPRDRIASASGVFNFFRILVGSGFGTSLSVELWTRLAIFHHARIAENLTPFNQKVTHFLSTFPFEENVNRGILDMQVDQQAYMLSTNDLSFLGALLFLVMIPILFLGHKTKTKTNAVPVAAE